MEIDKGFKIDNPNLFVSWDIDQRQLVDLFNGFELKFVTKGYYTISCESLKGLKCMLGFHFEQKENGSLNELEFFRLNYKNLKKSFDDFQMHFVGEFGLPNVKSKGIEGFSNYEWRLGNVWIVHFVYDRFGLEEHMRIKKIK